MSCSKLITVFWSNFEESNESKVSNFYSVVNSWKENIVWLQIPIKFENTCFILCITTFKRDKITLQIKLYLWISFCAWIYSTPKQICWKVSLAFARLVKGSSSVLLLSQSLKVSLLQSCMTMYRKDCDWIPGFLVLSSEYWDDVSSTCYEPFLRRYYITKKFPSQIVIRE